MLKKLNVLLITVGSFGFVSCGKNNGSPNGKSQNPEVSEFTPNGLSLTDSAGIPSSSKQFVMTRAWTLGPKCGGDPVVESRLKMMFYNAQDGSIASGIGPISVTAWMPEHGHDTGSEQPKAELTDQSVVKVSNIFFIMTGKWEVIVRAKIGELDEEWRFEQNIID